MAGIIVADTIQSGGSFIRLNSASQTVATINASGIYANTGNLLIAANGTIGVASITNTAITGTITQAQIGTGVTTTGPAFRVFQNSNQSIAANVLTVVNFQGSSFDTISAFNSSTNRYTPTVAGYYLFSAHIGWNNQAATTFLAFYKNGNEVNRGPDNGSVWVGEASCFVFMNGTTDYIEVRVQGNASQSIDGRSVQTFFHGFLARAA